MHLRHVALVSFVVVTASAVLAPIDGTLTGHMVQHVLLIAVAAPLLALALPTAPIDGPRWYAVASAGLALQAVVVVGWHAPAAFDATLHIEPLHGLEHLTMLGASVALWWVLVGTRPRRGESVIALFLATIPMTVLGVGLLLSTTPWYDAYRDVSDQQVAGAVMWAVGGGITVFEGAALFVAWLQTGDRARTPSPRRPPPPPIRPSPAR